MMEIRGLIDRKGELFAELRDNILYTLDGVATGRLHKDKMLDMDGNEIWLLVGDGLYTLDSSETIGYLGQARHE